MSVFVVTFAALALSGIFLAYNQHKRELSRPSKDGEVEAQDASIEAAALSFRRNFLIVYVLIMASDWLQACSPRMCGPQLIRAGPLHLHPLQRPEKAGGERSSRAVCNRLCFCCHISELRGSLRRSTWAQTVLLSLLWSLCAFLLVNGLR